MRNRQLARPKRAVMSDASERSLVRFYRAALDLGRAPSLGLVDQMLALLAEVTCADFASVEVSVGGPRLRRAWSSATRHDDEAVNPRTIAVPIVIGLPIGSVQLERSGGDARSAEDFAAADWEHASIVASQLALFAERFDHAFAQRGLDEELRLGARRRVVESIARNCGNVTAAARELRVSRSVIYRVTDETKSVPPRLRSVSTTSDVAK